MADHVILEGDKVNFMPNFGPAIVVVQLGYMPASGPATVGGKKICVAGDEAQLSIPGCSYTTLQYSVPGTGTLKINSLAPNQKAIKSKILGKAMLLKGGNFIAKFEVQIPAQQPPPGSLPDATPQYVGQGSFITTNVKCKAT